MLINNFSAFIGLGVTLSLGFIALESVKAFTQTLSERLFRFEAFIEEAFDLCKKILLDQSTVNSIRAANVDGKSTNNDLEEQKREHERLGNEIEKKVHAMKEEVCAICQARSMSAICIYLVFICAFLLLLGSMEDRYPVFVKQQLGVISFIAILYTLLGWSFGERTFKRKWTSRLTSFSSLRHASCSAILTLSLAFAVAIWRQFSPDNQFLLMLAKYDFWFLLAVTLLPYINFAVYIGKIQLKSKDIRTQVNQKRDCLSEECRKNRDKLEKLRTMGEYNSSGLSFKKEENTSAEAKERS